MAISLNGENGFGSRRRRGGAALSEINVTPFVDVVLVLLIIFMLTAHVMQFGIEVDVPKVKPVKETAQELPVVTIQKNGTTWLNGKPVNINDLADTIHQQFGKSKAVYVMADKECIYDPIAQVLATLGEAKINVNMVTQPEEATPRKRR